MSTDSIEKVLDLKGLLCPIPVVKIANAIKEVEVGTVVEATATDPGVMMDIPAWCASTGNELASMEEADNVFTFRVKRLK
ncbi:MAG: sulfurtransferase TusA family protein [Flavobacteriaceae bacterium]|nr:sulfurtransferase TusA family protein [Bacteroidia bacterium]MBT8267671.1 sulfurtransferase TusA family protein [Bacteroidia bacterium]NNL16892.1 sulfurtransferase TusA family protein [Flavobacteriaceae bacterium]